jgi:hypothetical protein
VAIAVPPRRRPAAARARSKPTSMVSEKKFSPALGDHPRIFVQIPSYRDPDCQWTVKDLFETAARPERVFVGILWQFVPELDQDCFVEHTRPDQVRIKAVHALDSGGYSWACAEVEKLWRAEEYTMRIDSHMRFEPRWDETLIDLSAKCAHAKSILTCYPEGFTPPRNIQGRGVVSKPVAKEFGGNRVLVFRSIVNPEPELPAQPMVTAFLAGGFYFGPSSMLRDVPWDPHLYFFGTEASMAARLWTHGYDLYAPNCSILYHNYERTGRKLHWEDHGKWAIVKERSDSRVRHLFGTEPSTDKEVLKNIDHYGFGKVRRLREYEEYTGISFKDCRLSPRATSFYFPYASRDEARSARPGQAPVQRERKNPDRSPPARAIGGDGKSAAADAKPANAQVWSSTSSYGYWSVAARPTVRKAEADARPAIDAATIQQSLHATGTDLLFGGDATAAIARLVSLGAPEAEARRIIDTAVSDPLIVNGREMALMLRRRDWLLESIERLHQLSPRAKTIEQRTELSGGEFLEFYYARNRPVVIQGEMSRWPARLKWSAEYFRAAAGLDPVNSSAVVPRDDGLVEIPMAADVFAPLADDLGKLEKFLDRSTPPRGGTVRLASPGGLVRMHCDPFNRLLAQISGRSTVKLASAADAARIYSRNGLDSDIADLDASDLDRARYPLLADIRFYDVTLDAGEILFVPLGWWHQIKAAEFGISASFVNFRWPNDRDRAFPWRLGPRPT